MSIKLHCNENERQWLTVDKDNEEVILNIFCGEMGVEVPVVLDKEQTQELIEHLSEGSSDEKQDRVGELEKALHGCSEMFSSIQEAHNRGECEIPLSWIVTLERFAIQSKKIAGDSCSAAGDGWISIKDQWPEPINGNKVIGYGSGYLFECEWDGDDWCNIGGENMTHWMPRPQPPQGRES